MKQNAWRKIAAELEIDPSKDGEMAKTLQLLTSEARRIGEVPMPKNYEDQLIRSLRAKLPLETSPGFWDRWAALFRMPTLSLQWTAAAVTFATIALVVGVTLRSPEHKSNLPIGESILLKTAKAADSQTVDHWVKSISDSSAIVVDRHIASLAEKMVEDLSPARRDKVVNSFVPVQEDI